MVVSFNYDQLTIEEFRRNKKCCFVSENAHMDIYQRLCTVKLFIAVDTLCSECRTLGLGFILVSCIMDRAYKNIWRAKDTFIYIQNIQLCI